LCVRRVAPTIPALAPAKALKSDASVPTRRLSSRASRAAESAAVTDEPPRGTVVATGLQQEASAAAAVMAVVTAASVVPLEPVPTAVDLAAC
jgi:hypothetical protein